MRESQRRWVAANLEKSREIKRRWAASHPEVARRWAAANPEKMRESQRRSQRRWYYANPETALAKSRNRFARQRKAPGVLTAASWARILTASKGRCFYCRKRRRLTMDHVIPLAKGGAHVPENVVAACGSCNSRKRDRLWLLA